MAPNLWLWIFAVLPGVLCQIKKMEPLTLVDGNSTTVSYREARYMQGLSKEKIDAEDPRGMRKVFAETQRTGSSKAIIAFFLFHDSAVAVSKNGKVQCVLELERLFKIRYFNSIGRPQKEFRLYWLQALKVVQERCECDDGVFPEYFHDALIVQGNLEYRAKRLIFPHIVEEVLKIGHWHIVGHITAHAALAFHGSSFRSALVLTYDADSFCCPSEKNWKGRAPDGRFRTLIAQPYPQALVEELTSLFAVQL